MKGKKEGRRSSNEERIKYREREGQRSRDEGGGGRGQRRAGESPAGPGPRPWGAPRPQEWQQLVYSEQEARPGPSGQPSAESSSKWPCSPSWPAPRRSSCVIPRAPLQGTEAADAAGGQSPASRSRSWVLETIL